jgi:hypothetical protein
MGGAIISSHPMIVCSRMLQKRLAQSSPRLALLSNEDPRPAWDAQRRNQLVGSPSSSQAASLFSGLGSQRMMNTENEFAYKPRLMFVGSQNYSQRPVAFPDARSGPRRQLPKPVKRVCNIKAKATPK